MTKTVFSQEKWYFLQFCEAIGRPKKYDNADKINIFWFYSVHKLGNELGWIDSTFKKIVIGDWKWQKTHFFFFRFYKPYNHISNFVTKMEVSKH